MVKSVKKTAAKETKPIKKVIRKSEKQLKEKHGMRVTADLTIAGIEGRLSPKEFESVGNLITGVVQDFMVEKYGLREVWLPLSDNPDSPKVNIFISPDLFTNFSTCLVLIQGTGPVRAGIWARGACMNHGLNMGSVLPMLEYAKKNGMSVVVMNPNMSRDAKGREISCSSTMKEHCKYVWGRFVNTNPAAKLAVIAHSAGGRCFSELFSSYRRDFITRVDALVFTDACYHMMFDKMNKTEKAKMEKIGIHYVSDTDPKVGRPLKG
jgi:hypothetical protein